MDLTHCAQLPEPPTLPTGAAEISEQRSEE